MRFVGDEYETAEFAVYKGVTVIVIGGALRGSWRAHTHRHTCKAACEIVSSLQLTSEFLCEIVVCPSNN